jgi:hypothetical protein
MNFWCAVRPIRPMRVGVMRARVVRADAKSKKVAGVLPTMPQAPAAAQSGHLEVQRSRSRSPEPIEAHASADSVPAACMRHVVARSSVSPEYPNARPKTNDGLVKLRRPERLRPRRAEAAVHVIAAGLLWRHGAQIRLILHQCKNQAARRIRQPEPGQTTVVIQEYSFVPLYNSWRAKSKPATCKENRHQDQRPHVAPCSPGPCSKLRLPHCCTAALLQKDASGVIHAGAAHPAHWRDGRWRPVPAGHAIADASRPLEQPQ